MFKASLILVVTLLCFKSIIAFNPPTYRQGDPRWGKEILGFGPNTIAAAGCLMTSVTSMVAGEGVQISGVVPTPDVMNNWLKGNNGFVSGDLFVWAAVEPLGFNFLGFVTAKDDVVNSLNQGHLVILNVMKGGHYVLALSDTGSGYSVMDPANFKAVYGYSEVVRAGLYTF